MFILPATARQHDFRLIASFRYASLLPSVHVGTTRPVVPTSRWGQSLHFSFHLLTPPTTQNLYNGSAQMVSEPAHRPSSPQTAHPASQNRSGAMS